MPPSLTPTEVTLIAKNRIETTQLKIRRDHYQTSDKINTDLSQSYKTLWGYFEHEIKWFSVFMIALLHLYTIRVYIYLIPDHWNIILWGVSYGCIGGFGVTAGAHRYYTHRCYKANLLLRIIFMICFTSAGQNNLYDWVRDHRVHHKFSETDADPHNSNRGFFFAHCGWLMLKKHPEVLRRGKTVDCSDILEDPVVRFHIKYFTPLKLFLCFIAPVIIPYYFWGWDLMLCTGAAIAKWVTLLNCTWSVNSVAHLWGSRPYDKGIGPVETKGVSFFSLGEGWHNYHHTFPWDYKAAELSYYFNVTTFWIDLFAKIGWAWDLKEPSKELVERIVKKGGDGSHFKWGHDVIEEES